MHHVRVGDGDYATRRARLEDRARILELCRASLGWSPDDPDEAFFRWKHDDNAFGTSPSWVAEAPDGALVGLRVFLRWRFRDPHGVVRSAVRAVDTATHPSWQGKGIFRTLTLGALDDLREDGVDFVFNTPNEKSMPGYLKMGWSEVGKVPVAARLASLRSIGRLRTANTASELWSEPVAMGEAATDAFADDAEVDELLAAVPPASGYVTDRTVAFLRWRYSFDPLHYRVVRLGPNLADGVIVFRVRRRGGALEAAVVDVIAPPRAKVRSGLHRIARDSGADYLLATTATRGVRPTSRFLLAAGLGPTLTWRPLRLDGVPALDDLALTLGDIELF